MRAEPVDSKETARVQNPVQTPAKLENKIAPNPVAQAPTPPKPDPAPAGPDPGKAGQIAKELARLKQLQDSMLPDTADTIKAAANVDEQYMATYASASEAGGDLPKKVKDQALLFLQTYVSSDAHFQDRIKQWQLLPDSMNL